ARQKVLKEGHSGRAWGELGKVLRAYDYYDASDVCFTQAQRFDPNEPRWPYYLGLSQTLRNPEDALPFLRRAVVLSDKYDRGNDAPRLRLAETLLQTGAIAECREQLDRVLSWNPDDPR